MTENNALRDDLRTGKCGHCAAPAEVAFERGEGSARGGVFFVCTRCLLCCDACARDLEGATKVERTTQ